MQQIRGHCIKHETCLIQITVQLKGTICVRPLLVYKLLLYERISVHGVKSWHSHERIKAFWMSIHWRSNSHYFKLKNTLFLAKTNIKPSSRRNLLANIGSNASKLPAILRELISDEGVPIHSIHIQYIKHIILFYNMYIHIYQSCPGISFNMPNARFQLSQKYNVASCLTKGTHKRGGKYV